MIPRITVHNRQRTVRLAVARLQSFAENALAECLKIRAPRGSDLSALPEVAVVLVSDRRIAQLHRQFMGISGPTDVITFQHGEVFISTETARKQARAFGSSTLKEIQLYVIHGLLHLHGFGDTTTHSAKEMDAIQSRIASRLAKRRAVASLLD